MELRTLIQEKSGPSQGNISASRVLAVFALLVGCTLIFAWWIWFLGVLAIPHVPVIAWDTIDGGMTWLGVTFLGSILPLLTNYLLQKRAESTSDPSH